MYQQNDRSVQKEDAKAEYKKPESETPENLEEQNKPRTKPRSLRRRPKPNCGGAVDQGSERFVGG